MEHPKYHSLLPRQAQDDLIRAAETGTTGSRERLDAIDDAISSARQSAPKAFKPLRTIFDREM